MPMLIPNDCSTKLPSQPQVIAIAWNCIVLVASICSNSFATNKKNYLTLKHLVFFITWYTFNNNLIRRYANQFLKWFYFPVPLLQLICFCFVFFNVNSKMFDIWQNYNYFSSLIDNKSKILEFEKGWKFFANQKHYEVN